MRQALTPATAEDVSSVVALRNAVAGELTARHGIGHWSSVSTPRGVRSSLKHSSIYVLKEDGRVVGTFVLQTKKPWAIDRTFFTPVARPLYLLGMAVDPAGQRRGIGRRCLDDAVRLCRD